MKTPAGRQSDFAKEEETYSKKYPLYASAFKNSRVWYADAIPLKCDDGGIESASSANISKTNVEYIGNYWDLGAQYREHVRNILTNKEYTKRLRPVKSENEINDGIARSPTPYVSIENLKNKLCDNTVRINKFDSKTNTITLQKSLYFDQLATNISCDETIIYNELLAADLAGRAATFRERDTDDKGGLRPLADCGQANTIGVATLFLDKNNIPILRFRKFNDDTEGKKSNSQERLAVFSEGWHCSSSGALKWEDVQPESKASTTLWDGLKRGMHREILEECGSLNGRPYKSVPIAYARELKRGGKPQFFMISKFHEHDFKEICDAIIDNKYIRTYGFKQFKTRHNNLIDSFEYHDSRGAPMFSSLSSTIGEYLYGFLILRSGNAPLDASELRRVGECVGITSEAHALLHYYSASLDSISID